MSAHIHYNVPKTNIVYMVASPDRRDVGLELASPQARRIEEQKNPRQGPLKKEMNENTSEQHYLF